MLTLQRLDELNTLFYCLEYDQIVLFVYKGQATANGQLIRNQHASIFTIFIQIIIIKSIIFLHSSCGKLYLLKVNPFQKHDLKVFFKMRKTVLEMFNLFSLISNGSYSRCVGLSVVILSKSKCLQTNATNLRRTKNCSLKPD